MHPAKQVERVGRDLLVTLQFSCSIVIIITVGVVYYQLDYMLSKNLGFDQEQILVIRRPNWLGNNVELFKSELLRKPNIQNISTSKTIPGKDYSPRSYRKKDDAETFLFLNNQVSHEYLDLFGLDLTAGRFFSKQFSSDSNAVVINETASKAFGFEDPIGKSLTSSFKKSRSLKIIGVVRDYNIESLHKTMAPVTLELSESNDSQYISVRLSNSKNVFQTLESVEDTWRKHTGYKPLQYFFLDTEFQKLYQAESNTGKILLLFASMAIFIACMGLIGLMTYLSNLRQKEIGIRKVLGASASAIVKLLSVNVVKLLGIAVLFSWPLSYYFTQYWLNNFADRISINPIIYLGAPFIVLVFITLAVFAQTARAASANPVDSLRDE